MKGLKHDADMVAPQPRQPVLAKSREILPDRSSTRPAVGRSSPASTINSVDFPEPDGPTSATVSPAAIVERNPAQDVDGPGRAPQSEMDIVDHHERAAGMKRAGHVRFEPTKSGDCRPAADEICRRYGAAAAISSMPWCRIGAISPWSSMLVVPRPVMAARPGRSRFWRQPDRGLRADARTGVPGAARSAGCARSGVAARVVNAGVSGDTTTDGLARLDWALADKPDLVILALGANDALRGIDPATVRANLDADDQKDQGDRRQSADLGHARAAQLGRGL